MVRGDLEREEIRKEVAFAMERLGNNERGEMPGVVYQVPFFLVCFFFHTVCHICCRICLGFSASIPDDFLQSLFVNVLTSNTFLQTFSLKGFFSQVLALTYFFPDYCSEKATVSDMRVSEWCESKPTSDTFLGMVTSLTIGFAYFEATFGCSPHGKQAAAAQAAFSFGFEMVFSKANIRA